MILPKSVALFVASTVLALTAACGASTAVSNGGPATAEVSLDNEFELAPGQIAALPDQGLTIRFDSVTNDSRCPVNVQCVWSGNALVFVSLKRNGTPAYQTSLNTTVGSRSVKDGNETVTLVSLFPNTDTRHPIGKGDYRLRLVVTTGT